MKVLVIGGNGAMGRHAVETLLGIGYCEQITVGVTSEAKGVRFTAKRGSTVSWVKVNILDSHSLNEAITDMDVVINAAGPYYHFGSKVLKACIAKGCHYFDLNDDWEPTIDMLELNKEAENSGITAVIGLGASPGISSMLSLKAMNELDSVDELYTGWDVDIAKPQKINNKPSAATLHFMHQLTGLVRGYTDGNFSDIKPMKKQRINYPGIGEYNAWTIGHPEVVTFPKYFPELRSSKNIMTTSYFNISGLMFFASMVNAGFLSLAKAANIVENIGGTVNPKKTPEKVLQKRSANGYLKMPILFAFAKGKKNNKPATVGTTISSAPAGGFGGLAGVPLALGVSLLKDKKIEKHGVFAPEGIIQPDDFFEYFAPFCSPSKKDFNDLVITKRSW